MSLINDDVMPFYIFQIVQTNSNTFETGNKHIEFLSDDTIGQNLSSLFFCSNQFNNIAVR